tara:strand:- start:5060 stop:5281 length:222 start_codon:yes stop_codon:yes gene_type:complete
MTEEWRWQDHYPSELEFARQMYSDTHKEVYGSRLIPPHDDVERLWEGIDELYAQADELYEEECLQEAEALATQ